MNRSIRIISLLLVLVFAVSSFTACGNPSNDPENTTVSTTAPQASEFSVKSSSGVCKIYYPDYYDGTPYFSTLMAMVAVMEAKTGEKLTLSPASSYSNDGSPALLVGDTGLEASNLFMNDLKWSDYGFNIVGNSLCVGAHTSSGLSKAIKLVNALINSKSGEFIIKLEECKIERGSYKEATINGTDISKFTIVYESESLLTAAEDLANAIGVRTGAVLDCKLASSAEKSENEILIGNVGRDATNSYYSNFAINSEYKVNVTGGTVAIVAKDELALDCGVTAFGKLFRSDDEKLELTDASSFVGTFYENSKLGIKARPEGTDIRIGCNNIYFHQKGDKEQIEVRDDYLYNSFKYMDSDILLLQEVSPLWHKTMDEIMKTELGYTLVPTKNDKTPSAVEKGNYTPIWYRAEKLDLVDYGHKQYESVKLEPDSYLSMSKSYTWALFKDKATGKQIITVTTHFTWAPENFKPTPNELRTADAKEVVALVGELEAKYAGIPIVLAGDLNCQEGQDPYKALKEKFSNVRSVCEQNNAIGKGTTHSVGSTSVGGAIIDHTLYTGDALNFKMYQHVYNEYSFNSTDHIPLLVDVEFK